jgi:hypothetical protein
MTSTTEAKTHQHCDLVTIEQSEHSLCQQQQQTEFVTNVFMRKVSFDSISTHVIAYLLVCVQLAKD